MILDSNEPDSNARGNAKSTRGVAESSSDTGHTLPAGLTCGSSRATGMNVLMCNSSAADSPAPIFPSRESGLDLRAKGRDSSSTSPVSATLFAPAGSCLKMYPASSLSHRGRDFALVLATLADLGYGVAWRVLDSRYFGVPQRRRRVFIVGHIGARSPEPFLPFLEGGPWDSASRETPRADVAGTLGGGSGRRGWCDDFDRCGAFIAHALTSQGFDASEDGTGRGTPIIVHAIAGDGSKLGHGDKGTPIVANHRSHEVRRLTPTECLRLQGFPDDWLGTPNEPPDGPRYRAIGDAVTVNVAQWIGERIMEAEHGETENGAREEAQ